MRRPGRLFAALGVALALLPAGCREKAHSRVGCYVAPGGAIGKVGRVVFLPLANPTDFPAVGEGLREELSRMIQGRGIFRVEAAARQPGGAADLAALSGKPLALKDLSAIRRASGADAVLVGSVTGCQPYPRMRVGLRLRLFDLRDGQLLWAVDHVWDATDEHTQRRMERFFENEVGEGAAPFDWELATVSPQAFQGFVAWEVAETLPGPAASASAAGGSQGVLADFRKNARL